MNIFDKIIKREIPSEIVLETDELIVIRDIQPVAPEHLLVIPKRCIVSIAQAEDCDAELLGKLLLAARDVAKKLGLDANGYRLVINTGDHGGQTVPHLHIHLLGQRQLGWPPG